LHTIHSLGKGRAESEESFAVDLKVSAYLILKEHLLKCRCVSHLWISAPSEKCILHKEQCMCLNFYFIFGRTAIETFEILKPAFKEITMSKTEVLD
jgi:hypothetical protein